MNIKRAIAVASINFRKTTWIAYLVAGLSFTSTLIQIIIDYIANLSDAQQVSEGNMLLLVPILAAVLIPAVNFRKLMHLNGKKKDFFWGSLLNYIILSAAISILNLILFYAVDKAVSPVFTVWNIIEIFGWTGNGIIVALLRQFVFYLLLCVTIHTITAAQTFWQGWLVDAILIAIISVFTPIAPLRTVLVDFFHLIIFNPNVSAHIGICLILTAAIYVLNIPILSGKKI